MDKLKNFLQKKKLDVKFKKAGGGHALASSSNAPPQQRRQPSPREAPRYSGPDSNVAAAALQRTTIGGAGAPTKEKQLTRSQQAIKAQARKELEEQQRLAGQSDQSVISGPEVRDLNSAPMLEEIFFTCELLGDKIALPKSAMVEAVAEFLNDFYEEDPVTAAVLMVLSLNRNRETRQKLLDTLYVYMDNLIGNPEEEKFRRIRVGNKAFQDRVASQRGGIELLRAMGFEEDHISPSPGAVPEPFLVIPLERAKEFDFAATKAVLMTTEPVPLKVHRNPKVLRLGEEGSGKDLDFRIPASFFQRTAEEIKREQEARSKEVDKLLTLRTKEMRDRDETLRVNKYKYCLLRVRFPDSNILEGTFGVYEPFSELQKFVKSCLDEGTQWAPFGLRTPEGRVFSEEEEGKSLADLGLVPAALLYFQFDDEVSQQLKESGQGVQYLSNAMLNTTEKI